MINYGTKKWPISEDKNTLIVDMMVYGQYNRLVTSYLCLGVTVKK